MGMEFELKYRADDEVLQKLQQAYAGPWQQIHMQTTYYDTPAGELSQRRYTLRRRFENGVSVCTLKTPAQGMGRGEWEVQADDILEAIPELCKLGCPQELLQLTHAGVEPICGARFTRLAKTVCFMGSRIELALDQGVLFCADRERAFCEVEAELKEGTPEDAMVFGCQLQRFYDLIPESKSKFRRALALREEC